MESLLDAYADLVYDGDEEMPEATGTSWREPGKPGLHGDKGRGEKDTATGWALRGYTLEQASEVLMAQAAKKYDEGGIPIVHRLSVSTNASSYGSATPSGYLDFRLFGDSNIDLTLTAPSDDPHRASNISERSSPALSGTSSPPTLLFHDGPESAWSPYGSPSPPPSPKIDAHPVIVEIAAASFPLPPRRSRSTVSSQPTISSQRTVSSQSTISSDTTRPKTESKSSKSSIVSTFKSKFRKAQTAGAPTSQTNSLASLNLDKVTNRQSLPPPPRPKPARREHSSISNLSSGSSGAEVVRTALDAFATTGRSSAEYPSAALERQHRKPTHTMTLCSPAPFPSPPKVAEPEWFVQPGTNTERRPSKRLPERPPFVPSPPRQELLPRPSTAPTMRTRKDSTITLQQTDSFFRDPWTTRNARPSTASAITPQSYRPKSTPKSFSDELRGRTSVTRVSRSEASESPASYSASFAGYQIVPKRASHDGDSSPPSPIPEYSLASKRLPPVDNRSNRSSFQPPVPQKDLPPLTRRATRSGQSDIPEGGMFRNPFQP